MSADFHCDGCGAEAGVAGEDADFFVEMAHDWEERHAHCGEPPPSGDSWLTMKSLVMSSPRAWRALLASLPDPVTIVDDLTDLTCVPRPSWAPADNDEFDDAGCGGWFCSDPAAVPNPSGAGERHRDGYVTRASVDVRAECTSDGIRAVRLTVRDRRGRGGRWWAAGTAMPPEVARRLADVLNAAADLAESR